MDYQRTKERLEAYACKWWPDKVIRMQEETSILPRLLRTQDKFISILTLSDASDPKNVFQIMGASNFAANLFLKHLMVITDFGSEPLQRVNRDFATYFPNNKFTYLLNGEEIEYTFTGLPVKGSLTNKKMKADVDGLKQQEELSPFYKDLIFLLLFGSNAKDEELAGIFTKCIIGNMLGNKDALTIYIKQRYLYVSRIIGGSVANDLGNAAQVVAEQYLKAKLGNSYSVKSNGHIPNVSQNDRTLTTFDLAIGHEGKYVGVEISFQVTTNSTIERKAGQARDRYKVVHDSGNYVAYIIDGAGNFQRSSALETICSHSDCTVAYTDTELDVLIEFVKEKIGGQVH